MKIIASASGLIYGFILGRVKTKSIFKSMLGGVLLAVGVIALFDYGLE